MTAVAKYPVSMYKRVRHALTGKPAEEGASLVEYGLLVALIAVVCVAAITALGVRIDKVFDDIVAALG